MKLGGNPENLREQDDKAVTASIEAWQDSARKRSADVAVVIVDLKRQGAKSLRQIAAGLNEREVRTARGSKWTAIAVSRALSLAARVAA
ncbi:MAG TPA: recombinase family protein [Vineibacter sp.]|nr:recombinase family protein [Vineibacter sp.]